MKSFLRTISLFVTAFFATLILGTTVVVAALLGVKDKPDGLFDKAPRWWSTIILWATGIKVRVHGLENVKGDEPHIFASKFSPLKPANVVAIGPGSAPARCRTSSIALASPSPLAGSLP